jgi:hypothetical protein
VLPPLRGLAQSRVRVGLRVTLINGFAAPICSVANSSHFRSSSGGQKMVSTISRLPGSPALSSRCRYLGMKSKDLPIPHCHNLAHGPAFVQQVEP